MNQEKFILDQLSKIQWNEPVQEEGLVLAGCIAMYQKTQNNTYKEVVIDYVNRNQAFLNQDYIMARALRFLYEESKDNSYKMKLESLLHSIEIANRSQGRLVHEDGSNYSVTEIFNFMPTYAWYETFYNKKEHYNDIMAQLQGYVEINLSSELFLMTLADTVLSLSEEIYEAYAKVKAWLKAGIHQWLSLETRDSQAKLMAAYAIMVACESKSLLPEKYEEMGKDMAHNVIASYVESGKDLSLEELGTLMMLDAKL